MRVTIVRKSRIDTWVYGAAFSARDEASTYTGQAIVGPLGAHVLSLHVRTRKDPKPKRISMTDPAVDVVATAVHEAMAEHVRPTIDWDEDIHV